MISNTLSTFEYYVAEHTDNGMSRIPERVAKDAVEELAAQAEKIATLQAAFDKLASMTSTTQPTASPRLAADDAGVRDALRDIVEFCDDPEGSEKPESLGMGLARLLPAARAALLAKREPNHER